MKFNTLLWLLTTGLQFGVGWWYRKQPVFFLPQGWLGPLGWWLALPFAPAGASLSFLFCTIYNPICARLCHVALSLACLRLCKYTHFHRFRNAFLPPFISFSKLMGETPTFYATFFTGSVSVGVWQIACRRLIIVGEKAVKNFAGKKLILCRTPIFFINIICLCDNSSSALISWSEKR